MPRVGAAGEPGATNSTAVASHDASAAAPPAPSQPASPACGDPGDVVVLASPAHAVHGAPLRVVAVTDRLVDATLTVRTPAGAVAVASAERHGGPPYFYVAQVDAPAPGKWSATLGRDERCAAVASLATQTVTVHDYALAKTDAPRSVLWRTHAAWNTSFENLFAAWIEAMFEAPLDAQPSWNALHEVLRDRSRNLLFDHLGAGEDDEGITIRPDCADLPYFLRAYFAYKLGLPFAWSRCSRGDGGSAPSCTDFATSLEPFPAVDGGAPPTPPLWADPARPHGGPWDDGAKRLGEFFRTTLADSAQSGAGRTRADDDETDYYPIVLSAETLRPGTIFGDPYGHVLVVAQRVPQTATSGGILLAVDGQPDGTVARKRFWRGNFLFAIDPALGNAGFKRFRPIARDRVTGKLRRLTNAELADFSATDQYAGGVEGFYDKMDDVLSPAPLDPTQALLETVRALEEQVKTRATSVDNGRKFLASGKPPADMPEGPKIFETTGDWEDFSTPSRDLRLLIAVDVVAAFPARFARRPERYAVPAGKAIDPLRAELEARLGRELGERSFEYVRTDGSPWKLTLREVVDREVALEMAYNPNDCVEHRWGAVDGTPEAATCAAHAPDAQVAKMLSYRDWFHKRTRPPR